MRWDGSGGIWNNGKSLRALGGQVKNSAEGALKSGDVAEEKDREADIVTVSPCSTVIQCSMIFFSLRFFSTRALWVNHSLTQMPLSLCPLHSTTFSLLEKEIQLVSSLISMEHKTFFRYFHLNPPLLLFVILFFSFLFCLLNERYSHVLSLALRQEMGQ